MRLDDVRKICALRSNSIGDYIFSLPALESLKAAYPGAEIVLLGKPWHAAFLKGRPGPVDRVLTLPYIRGICETPGGRENPGEISRFLNNARKERFDICCQLYGGGKYSNPFLGRLEGRLTVGMKAPDADASSLDSWIPYIYYYPEVMRYLEVAALAGAPPVTTRPRLAVTERDRQEALAAFPRQGPYAVLHPGATDPRRRWPAEKFADAGKALITSGIPVCITGAGDERGICSFLVSRLPGATDLYGKLSLGGLAGLLAGAALLLSNDSGPLHLARAVGTRTVAVYWIGNYINAGPPDMASHRSHLSWRLECPLCGTNCIESSCPHRSSFVADVPSGPVTGSCLELLASPQR